jgi:hypothetical protein
MLYQRPLRSMSRTDALRRRALYLALEGYNAGRGRSAVAARQLAAYYGRLADEPAKLAAFVASFA